MKPETLSFYHQAVRRTVERIIDGLDDALDLELLARAAALSPFHFHRVFRGMVGETPLELHRRLRIERAAWRLLNASTSVTSIAFDAGYDTHEAFTRAFRDRYGCSPSEFRRSECQGGMECVRPRQIELAARSAIHYRANGKGPVTDFVIEGEQIMHVDITDMQELRIATLRHIGPYNRISETFARLGDIVGAAGLIGPDTTMLAIYHDDPETTAPQDLRSDAAITMSPEATLPDGLVEQRIPAGRYACTTHLGPYELLADTWERFMGEWLPRSGQRFGQGVSFEVYRNTPGQVPENELRTDIYIPLAQ
jgi:AraC family transcriptional regulator